MTGIRASRVAAIALVVILGGCSPASPGAKQSGTLEPTPAINTMVSDPPHVPQLSAADYMTVRVDRPADQDDPSARSSRRHVWVDPEPVTTKLDLSPPTRRWSVATRREQPAACIQELSQSMRAHATPP